MMKTFLMIFLGGGCGASLRFAIGRFTPTLTKYHFPIITFSINILACFIMGYLYAVFLDRANMDPALKLALTVGFCGGFSTYTAFSLELLEMFKSQQVFAGIIYITGTIIIGVLAVWLGVKCGKLL